MEVSFTDESTTSDGLSPPRPRPRPPPAGLSRMGSGGSASVILDGAEEQQAESSKKLRSSKYKGVVPQPNGRWGAQIYEKHQRVWLGTFNNEDDAARSYDVAAHRFRGLDAVINFKPLNDPLELEASFLSSHSKSEIVDMLRKHTYSDELHQSRRHFKIGGAAPSSSSSRPASPREQLFEKMVTPSDVGKLNRLVIPKQHAEKHFPMEAGNGNGKGLLLNFEDMSTEKVWRFRYSYWNSSQSYVLTKGWSRFVKDKSLKAGDLVCFLRGANQLYIDCRSKTTSSSSSRSAHVLLVDLASAGPVLSTADPIYMPSIRLFGVDINSEDGTGYTKRGRGEDDVVLDLFLSLDNSNYRKRTVTGPLS